MIDTKFWGRNQDLLSITPLPIPSDEFLSGVITYRSGLKSSYLALSTDLVQPASESTSLQIQQCERDGLQPTQPAYWQRLLRAHWNCPICLTMMISRFNPKSSKPEWVLLYTRKEKA